MAYASGATLATLFGEIDVWLRNEPLYKNENLEAGVLVGIYNRLIDALHLGRCRRWMWSASRRWWARRFIR